MFKISLEFIPNNFIIIICDIYAEMNMLKYVLNIAKQEFLKFYLNKNFINKKNDIKFTRYRNGSLKNALVKIAIIDAERMYIIDCCLDGLKNNKPVKNFS